MNWSTGLWENFRPAKEIDYLFNIEPEELKKQDIRLIIIDLDHTLTGLESRNVPIANILWLIFLKSKDPLKDEGINYCITTHHPWRPYLGDIEEQVGQTVIRNRTIFNSGKNLIRQAWQKFPVSPAQTLVINDSRILLSPARKMGCLTYRVMPIEQTERGLASLFLRFLRWIEKRFVLPQLIKSQ